MALRRSSCVLIYLFCQSTLRGCSGSFALEHLRSKQAGTALLCPFHSPDHAVTAQPPQLCKCGGLKSFPPPVKAGGVQPEPPIFLPKHEMKLQPRRGCSSEPLPGTRRSLTSLLKASGGCPGPSHLREAAESRQSPLLPPSCPMALSKTRAQR